MKKEIYDLSYFILNQSFKRYVLDKIQADTIFWESFIQENQSAIDSFNEAKEIITFISEHNKVPSTPILSDEVFNSLHDRINTENRENTKVFNLKFKWYWYAASAIIIVGFSILYFFVSNPKVEFSASMLQVFVPHGQRSQVVLPDGTHVWLNSGSVLKYPASYGKGNRYVFVSGEAFFNVKHQNGEPFFVHLRNNLAIKVTGTEFNVKCYPDEKSIETTLLKGSVNLIQFSPEQKMMRLADLKPNQKAIYFSNSKTINILEIGKKEQTAAPKETNEVEETTKQSVMSENSELEVITSWKEDALMFHNETFEEIAVRMERWYGLKIQIVDEEIKQERFTGKFVNNESIYQLLDIINRTEPIRYKTEGKEIIITKK